MNDIIEEKDINQKKLEIHQDSVHCELHFLLFIVLTFSMEFISFFICLIFSFFLVFIFSINSNNFFAYLKLLLYKSFFNFLISIITKYLI